MEGKIWLFPVLLTFVFAGLLMNLFVHDMREEDPTINFINPLNGELVDYGNQIPFPTTTLEYFRGMLTVMVGGGGGGGGSSSQTNYTGIPLSPNLSTCHPSLSNADRPVFCCPPPSPDQPITDFVFPPHLSPLRVRRPAHLLTDDDYSNKYQKAVAIMKQLHPDHPHNFYRQADIHCIYCTGAYNQANSTTTTTTTLLKIHGSWLFFPWHRMFIYFHERIIGKLIGDDTFALPYWNWDSPDGMAIPDLYMNGALRDGDRDQAHSPPEIVDIDFNDADKGLKLEDQIATNLAFMYNQMVSGAKKVELFMGCKLRSGEEGRCDGPGTIEAAPHNTLHRWVGSNLNPERENMGSFYSAARDPLFFGHHANIDRLWTVWKELNGIESEFVDHEWLDSHFYFYDENVNLVRVKVRDVLDTFKLGYMYEEVELPWLGARPKPSIPPKIARELLKMRHDDGRLRLPGSTDDSVEFESGNWTLDRAIRTKIHRPRWKREKMDEEVLVVYGIEIKEGMYVKFDVFVNAIDETIASPLSREFAGSFVSAPHGAMLQVRNKGEQDMKLKSSFKIGVSEILEDLEADEDESIWVTLVPRTGNCVNTTVDGIRIEFM